jgi:hypothetical protein
MNQNRKSVLNLNLRPLALGAVAALFCSCASTSVKQTWRAPDCHQITGKIAVLAIDDRGLVREGFENRFVRDLDAAGASALVTSDQLTLPDINADKRAAADHLHAMGAEALLLVRLGTISNAYRVSHPGEANYTPTANMANSFNNMGWHDYYSVGFMDMSPTYGNLKQSVDIETSLYDLKTDKRLWAAQTQTVVSEHDDRVAEVDPMVAKVVEAMRKDGLIQ